MYRTPVITGLVGAAVLGSTFLATGASAAPADHPIHGTCRSDGGLYASSNVRVMGGTSIKLTLYTTPTKGIIFQAHYARSIKNFGPVVDIPANSHATYTLKSYAPKGTEFLNLFQLLHAGHQANYSFTGDEHY